MRKRVSYLLIHFVTIWLLFLIQKPLFMLLNGAVEQGVTGSEYLQVMLHGATLDATTAGYTTALPWLVMLVSLWFKEFPLRKVLGGYLATLALLLSLIFVVDAGLYPFWGFKLDGSIFLYLDSPSEALASVSVGFLLLRTAAILLLWAGVTKLLLTITPRRVGKVKQKLIGTGLLLLLGGGLFVTIRGGVRESTANIGQVYFSDNQFLNHSAVNPAFSLLSSLGKSERYEEEFNFFDEEKRAQLFAGLYPGMERKVGTENKVVEGGDTVVESDMVVESNRVTKENGRVESSKKIEGETVVELLRTKRPNVLVVLWEGLGATFVEPLGGMKGVTPHFNQLCQEGVLFTNCYANSFRTDRGTLSTFSGYLGFPTLSVMKMPAKSRTLPSFTQSLLEAGYSTDFLYGGDINFTNMKSYLLSKGYQRVTADVDFSSRERKTGAWGVTDSITFNHLYHELVGRVGQEQPWHTAFLTLSSHEPFDDVPYHRLEEKIPNAFAYTDHCFGNFIAQLKETELWENLLIVCLADHGFFYPREGNPTDPAYFQIPMLWLGGAVKEATRVESLMNQSDLAATLLGQMELDSSAFGFSRNVLSSSYKYPFAFYSFSNGFAFQDSTGTTRFDNNSEKVTLEIGEGEELRLERGKAILQSLYDDLGGR
ncbi:MAG: LTA synthase family protein [Phocaeicola sp.]